MYREMNLKAELARLSIDAALAPVSETWQTYHTALDRYIHHELMNDAHHFDIGINSLQAH